MAADAKAAPASRSRAIESSLNVALLSDLVQIVDGYDRRPGQRFDGASLIASSSTAAVSECGTRFSNHLNGQVVGIRGERTFETAATHWSILVPYGSRAYVGIVNINAERSTRHPADFPSSAATYFHANAESSDSRNWPLEGMALGFGSSGDCLRWSQSQNVAELAVRGLLFSFTADVSTGELWVARNGVSAERPMAKTNLNDMTVYVCLTSVASVVLHSDDE